VLIAGTVPGVIAGSVIRVELLTGPHVFDLVVATVLLRARRPAQRRLPARPVAAPATRRCLPFQTASTTAPRTVQHTETADVRPESTP
jgi:hypothetical protein